MARNQCARNDKVGSDVTEATDFDYGCRHGAAALRGAARVGANANHADRAAERANCAAAPPYHDYAAAVALPPLHRLVRIAIPAERHGALSADALLVGAGQCDRD